MPHLAVLSSSSIFPLALLQLPCAVAHHRVVTLPRVRWESKVGRLWFRIPALPLTFIYCVQEYTEDILCSQGADIYYMPICYCILHVGSLVTLLHRLIRKHRSHFTGEESEAQRG